MWLKGLVLPVDGELTQDRGQGDVDSSLWASPWPAEASL